jgi:hypothetical protein
LLDSYASTPASDSHALLAGPGGSPHLAAARDYLTAVVCAAVLCR